jgi:hypothetical protein
VWFEWLNPCPGAWTGIKRGLHQAFEELLDWIGFLKKHHGTCLEDQALTLECRGQCCGRLGINYIHVKRKGELKLWHKCTKHFIPRLAFKGKIALFEVKESFFEGKNALCKNRQSSLN